MKPILDACCGGRMFWFDKQNPLAIFMDNREFSDTLCDGRSFEVKPDILGDFTAIPFPDSSFKLVVFDPPHILKAGDDAWVVKKYGRLPGAWEFVLREGFNECMRVLEDYGVLIFKWCEDQIPVHDIIEVVGQQPLFGHRSGRRSQTHWMTFMKIPEDQHANPS